MGHKRLILAVFLCSISWSLSEISLAKEKIPLTKSIRGHVTDSSKNSIVGAKVFIKNSKKNTTTVLVTDSSGLYAIFGLDPKEDYDVHAEYGKIVSETKTISSFLNRYDNVINFELGAQSASLEKRNPDGSSKKSVELQTADGVRVSGDWYRPSSKPDQKFSAVLLLHDFGEDRTVWESFITDLLKNKLAALSIDLRGHGTSLLKGNQKLTVDRTWLTDTKQFPLDLGAAINWLKSQEEVDQNRIAVVGAGVGANLAFVASGEYEAVRSAVALSGNPVEAQTLAGDIKNFEPHSILYVATAKDDSTGEYARQFEKLTGFPVRVQVFEDSDAHGSKILQEIPEATTLVIDWLKNM